MPEVIIKYKNAKALELLQGIAKYFDFVVEKPKARKNSHRNINATLPIEFAEKPDVSALAGIWKGKDISLQDLRKKAWGNRL